MQPPSGLLSGRSGGRATTSQVNHVAAERRFATLMEAGSVTVGGGGRFGIQYPASGRIFLAAGFICRSCSLFSLIITSLSVEVVGDCFPLGCLEVRGF